MKEVLDPPIIPPAKVLPPGAMQDGGMVWEEGLLMILSCGGEMTLDGYKEGRPLEGLTTDV